MLDVTTPPFHGSFMCIYLEKSRSPKKPQITGEVICGLWRALKLWAGDCCLKYPEE